MWYCTDSGGGGGAASRDDGIGDRGDCCDSREAVDVLIVGDEGVSDGLHGSGVGGDNGCMVLTMGLN